VKFVSFGYEVEARITITSDELLNMLECARSHYDFACREAGQPGGRGFLWSWKNQMLDLEAQPIGDALRPEENVDVTARQLDLLLKILESPAATNGLYRSVSDVYNVLANERNRVGDLQAAQSRLGADEVVAVRCGECGVTFNGFECVTKLVRHRIAEHVRKGAVAP